MEKETLEAIKQNENVAANINTDQLWEGKRSDGVQLPNYSRRSVEVFGKPNGPIRLFDTGDFYRGIFLEAEKFPVMFNSKDSKTVLLTQKYGEQIFGLSEENMDDFGKSYVVPALAKRVKDILDL